MPAAPDAAAAKARQGCTIRLCARERGYELCSSCGDLEGCARFDWLGKRGRRIGVCCGWNNFRPSKHGAIKTVNTATFWALMQAGNPDIPSEAYGDTSQMLMFK